MEMQPGASIVAHGRWDTVHRINQSLQELYRTARGQEREPFCPTIVTVYRPGFSVPGGTVSNAAVCRLRVSRSPPTSSNVGVITRVSFRTKSSAPLTARAQQPVPRIGFVYPGPAGPAAVLVEALVKGLREAGFAAPAQVEIVVRSADGNAALIAPLVNEVFANNVSVFVANGPPVLNVARKAGVVQPPHEGFVCFFFDYNNDGWPDILTTALAPWEATVEGLRKGYAPANARSVHPDAPHLFRNNACQTIRVAQFGKNHRDSLAANQLDQSTKLLQGCFCHSRHARNYRPQNFKVILCREIS